MHIEPFQLERWMSRYETEVTWDIAESGIYPLTMREVVGLLPEDQRAPTLETLMDLRLGYSEARGSLALRELLAATYDATTPNEILVTTGAIEANFLLFNTLLSPGDHVIAVAPAYQQLNSVPRAIGCEVDLWRVRHSGGFHFDLAELQRLLRPTTRLIVINTPHNPTGAMLTEENLSEVYGLAESVGAWVMCDEAYRWLELPGGPPLAAPIRNHGPRGISIGTFSKPFGLPGLRTGWIAGPEDIVQKCWAMRDYVSLSPAKLNDALAIIALTHRDQIAERTRKIVAENLDFSERWFAENADIVSWTPPQGGLLALMKYELPIASGPLANRLAEDYKVMLAPGSAFGYEGYLRIGVGMTPPLFAEGLRQAATCFRDTQRA